MWGYGLDWTGSAVINLRVPGKCVEFLDQLRTGYFLKKDSAPWINHVHNVCTVLHNIARIYVTYVMSVLLLIYICMYISSSSSSSCSWRVRHVSLFLDPPDEVGPSISSSVVLCFFFRLVCSRRERVQAKVQRLKTGPIQLREHTPTEKHAGLEASKWQPHH